MNKLKMILFLVIYYFGILYLSKSYITGLLAFPLLGLVIGRQKVLASSWGPFSKQSLSVVVMAFVFSVPIFVAEHPYRYLAQEHWATRFLMCLGIGLVWSICISIMMEIHKRFFPSQTSR